MGYTPIIRTTVAALCSVLTVAWIHRDSLTTATAPTILISLGLGILYTQLAEYWCHRVPMHRRVRFLEGVRLSHARHHRRFHGDRFQTRNRQDLEHIAGKYWAYPVLLLLHYALLAPWLPPSIVVPFLVGTCAHYVAFEVSHWLTHVDGNAIDRVIVRVPWLGKIREYQIEHHRMHHERPIMAFNFNPPYLGDRLFTEALAPTARPAPNQDDESFGLLPAPEPTPPPLNVWRARAFRYGSALAVGVAVVGIAVVARGMWTAQSRSPAG